MLRREKIIKEFFETEKSYVSSLNICIKVNSLSFNYYFYYFFWKTFLQPLLNSVIKEEDPIIPSEEIKNIFSIIEIIAKLNGDFLNQFKKKMENFSATYTLLSDIFDDLVRKKYFF